MRVPKHVQYIPQAVPLGGQEIYINVAEKGSQKGLLRYSSIYCNSDGLCYIIYI